jgi:outer membrane protein assembly factor BamE (lipoprotein component of BamABCDE complex)
MRTTLDQQKEKLLALDQMQVVELLGRPDQNELSSRNQKFFYYFIEPGPDCQSSSGAEPERLAIRFNAMGLAKEVAIVRGEW